MLLIGQFCFYFIFHLPLKIWSRAMIEGIEHIPQKPFIIAANHTSKVDPFLLCLLPLSAIRRLLPVYFLTAEQYHQRWYLRPILKLLGSYPVAKRAWTLHDFLSTTIEKIETGKVVMFFPEGRVVRNEEETRPKAGIGYLAEQTQKPILPLHIRWEETNGFFVKKLFLTFGKTITPTKDNSKISYENETIKIMNIIYSL